MNNAALAMSPGLGERGLYRRWYFEECLSREVARARRYGESVSVVLLRPDTPPPPASDLDHGIAEFLHANLRGMDVAADYSSGEVALLLPDTAVGSAFLLAERLRRGVETLSWASPHETTVSAGVSAYRPDADLRADDLMFEVENALYAARREGGGRTRVFRCPEE
ncbi:MAG: GGDEF domain-containing protein [Actinomycetota bacterium]